jgi:hypothetical protein
MNEKKLRKLQTEKDRQITTLEKSLADTFHRMEVLLERLVGQNNGRDDKTEPAREMNESFLSVGLFAEEAKQEQQVETELTRDTAMNESFLSDGSFFAEDTEHEQHCQITTRAISTRDSDYH